MTQAIVLDIGTAKIKLGIGRFTPGQRPSSVVTCETLKLKFNHASDSEIASAIGGLLHAHTGRGTTTALFFATQAAREDDELASRLARILNPVGPLNILTGEQEAKLLKQTLKLTTERAIGCEIGGGSVQLVGRSGLAASIPYGAVTLSKRFGYFLGEAEETQVRRFLRVELKRVLEGVTSDAIVLGTNQMATFVRAVKRFGLPQGDAQLNELSRGTRTSPEESVRVAEMEALLPLVRSLRPDDFPGAMPEDPGFLYGAHKVFLLVLELARLTQAAAVVGTNASSYSFLARKLATGAYRTGPMGLQTCSVTKRQISSFARYGV